MRTYIFETTVLSAFAVVERLDLLEQRYTGRAAWTIEVHKELSDGLAEHPRLSDVLTSNWLGDPIASPAVDEIERTRLLLGGKSAPGNLDHLGEASSIVVAEKEGYVVATDDYDATRFARARDLETVNTLAILRAAVRDRQLSARRAVALRNQMVEEHGRRLPEVSEPDFRGQ